MWNCATGRRCNPNFRRKLRSSSEGLLGLISHSVNLHRRAFLRYPSAVQPKELVRAWVDAFNRADVDALASLYQEDAINHQVAESPAAGRRAIRQMFEKGFASAKMLCIVENLFEDGEWAILEWRDPKGLRGCGFFLVRNGKIAFQRGYWDKLSFMKSHGIPLET